MMNDLHSASAFQRPPLKPGPIKVVVSCYLAWNSIMHSLLLDVVGAIHKCVTIRPDGHPFPYTALPSPYIGYCLYHVSGKHGRLARSRVRSPPARTLYARPLRWEGPCPLFVLVWCRI